MAKMTTPEFFPFNDAYTTHTHPASPVASAAASALHDAGRFRRTRRLPPPAPLPAGAHASGAGKVGLGRDVVLRSVQHPVYLEHRHRRMGSRQTDPVLPADG